MLNGLIRCFMIYIVTVIYIVTSFFLENITWCDVVSIFVLTIEIKGEVSPNNNVDWVSIEGNILQTQQ